MKKALMSSSAIVLAAAISAPANAAEVELGFGGYFEAWIGFGSTDSAPGTDFDGVDVKYDAELAVLPSITLDNGIKIGANAQIELNDSTDDTDEAYMFIKGSFGEVLLGSENSAGYKMTYAAPDVSFFGVNSGSTTNFVNLGSAAGLFRETLGATFIENVANNDAARISYFTPRFAGFQLGVSYARDGGQQNGQPDLNGGTLGNIFDVGANFVDSFGGVDIAVSGRWGIADVTSSPAVAGTPGLVIAGGVETVRLTPGAVLPTDTVVLAPTAGSAATAGTNPEIWGAGVNIGFGGFTIGGSFAEQNDAGLRDGIGYDIGVSYRTGPWGFSATWMHGENVDDELPIAGADEELDQYLIAIDYDLAKGVDLNLVGGYVDFSEDVGASGTSVDAEDITGFFIATGARLRW